MPGNVLYEFWMETDLHIYEHCVKIGTPKSQHEVENFRHTLGRNRSPHVDLLRVFVECDTPMWVVISPLAVVLYKRIPTIMPCGLKIILDSNPHLTIQLAGDMKRRFV